MCGIVARVSREKTDLGNDLCSFLSRLEYRGYDSSGIAYVEADHLRTIKTAGQVCELQKLVPTTNTNIGIGHTRWATHGKASYENAHPHGNDHIAIVHNGIIENYKEIKEQLKDRSYETDVDSEVIWHYIDHYLKQGLNLDTIFFKMHEDFKGAYAIAALVKDGDKSQIYATRNKSPMAIAHDADNFYIASDALSLPTEMVAFLDDCDVVKVDETLKFCVLNKDQCVITPNYTPTQTPYVKDPMDKGPFKHFMLKEIFEQPLTLTYNLNHLENSALNIDTPKRILIVGCGTSYHAGYVAKYWFEEIANIETHVQIASEFRYQKLFPYDLAICISQSGETIDVLGGLEIIKARNIETLGVLNVIESSLGRMVDYILPTCVGTEVSVASTKAFTGQLCSLFYLAHYFALDKKLALNVIRAVIQQMEGILNVSMDALVKKYDDVQNVFYIGRNKMYPMAMEGALKLKEICYLNANAYPSGELKHGSIALTDERTLTVVLLDDDHVFEKTLSNAEEAAARGSKMLFILPEKLSPLVDVKYDRIVVPDSLCHPILLSPILHLFAYYMADRRNYPIDRPRHIAKSLTVE